MNSCRHGTHAGTELVPAWNVSCKGPLTIETGLSDFYLMIATVLKGGFVKRGPKIITYRDYSRFSTIDFRNHLFI